MVINTYQELNNLFKERKKRVYIAGAGNYGKILGDYFNQQKYSWAGFIDRSKRGILCGKEIFPADSIKENIDYIFIAAISFADEIYREFVKGGLHKEKIVVFQDSELLLDILIKTNHFRSRIQNIERFKGKYYGKRCFVIGNGPSLTTKDLDCLRNEVTFASNSVYAMYEHTIWRPTYYGISDPSGVRAAFSDRIRQKIIDSSEAIFVGLSNWNLIHKNKIEKLYFFKDVRLSFFDRDLIRFSSDASKAVYASATITYILLQLAVYMGFKEIYLLGMDFTFSTERKADGTIIHSTVTNHNNHIEEAEQEEIYNQVYDLTGYNYLAETDYQLWGYQTARKYADSHEIKICNATRGGKLEVFERVDFDSLF